MMINARTIGTCLVVFAAAGIAQAQTTRTWDAEGSDNKWTNQVNWSADTVPAADNIASLTLASAGDQTIVYDTALYGDAADGPRTVSIGNTGGGVTTLVVSNTFRTRVSNDTGLKALNLNAGGVWRHISGTTAHNDNILINGGTLKVEGGGFTFGGWPVGTPLDVRNGGAIEVTGGTVTLPANSGLAVIGKSGTGSLTFGSAGGTITGAGDLQVGSGTNGTGTVTWNRTADMNSIALGVDIQNGSFTIASGAGNIFVNNGSGWAIGTSTGTATLNKNNAGNIGADRSATGGNLIHVGANGTVNWAGGGINSNQGDDYIFNQGTWNYTKTSGAATWRVGADFRNDGTFSWQGAGGLTLHGSTTTAGTGTFRNRSGGTLETTRDGRADLTGTLILENGGTFRVSLGAATNAGIQSLASGANGGYITVGGALEVVQAAGFQGETDYNILTSSRGGTGITFNELTLPERYILVDDGTSDGTVTIRMPPPRGTVISIR